MKLFSIFMFAFVLCASANGYSQKQLVTLDLHQCNVSALFKEIRKQTGLRFVYNEEHVAFMSPFDIKMEKKSVKEVLDEVFKKTSLRCVFENDVIYVIRRDKEKQVRDSLKIVKGVVKDEAGGPLPGVTVIVKGTTLGVSTDKDGGFQIVIPRDTATLIFTFMGMKTQSVSIPGLKTGEVRKELKITMKEDELEVEEVIVTGYGNIRKSSFTGKAVTIQGEDLKKVANRNIIKAIQVFDPSFRIKTNNKFGSDPNALPEFNIRGNSSIGITGLDEVQSVDKSNLRNNTNLPIFIMDGFEVGVEKIYDMDMNRVENINILKDAAATAMYGSRAANGVVVITTIRPKAGEVRVRYNFMGEVTTPDLSDYNLMNASEKLEAERLAGIYMDSDPNTQLQLEKLYLQRLELVQKGVDTDWLSQPLRNIFNHKHTLYIDGGADAIRFGVNMMYDRNNGVMKGSYRNVMTAGLDLEYRYRKIQIRNSVSYTSTGSDESPYGYFSEYSRKQPYDKFKDEHGNYLLKTNIDLNNNSNPLYDAFMCKSYSRSDYRELTENLSVNWYMTNGIQMRGEFSVAERNGEDKTFTDPNSSTYAIDQKTTDRGSLYLSEDRTVSLDGNITFLLNKTLAGKHFINVHLGINARQSKYGRTSSSYVGFPLGITDEIAYAKKIREKPSTYEQTSRLIGYFGAVNYSFKDIYLFDASGRMDGSSEFGTNNKFAPFWALGIGINIHKYEWMQRNKRISKLKLRGSIGQVGKVNFPAYAATSQFSIYSDDWYSTGAASKLVYLGNPDLKWEITKTTDAGLEVGFWNDRFTADFSYYRKHTYDMISSVTIPSSSGFTEYQDNMGEIINEGFEVDVRFQLIRKRDINLILFGNIGHNDNRIAKISASLQSYNEKVEALLNKDKIYDNDIVYYEPISRYVKGGSTTSIFAMRSAGIDPANGREKFIKRDGTSTYDYDAVDEVIVGDTQPDYQGSFGVNVYYKGFSLYATFMYEFGGQLYNSTLVSAVENADIANSNVDKRVSYDRWIDPGDRTPLKDIKNREYTTKPTSRFVQDNNWLALTNISIGYDLPGNFLRKIGISQCGLQLSTSDPFRWSSIRLERGLSYPYARTYNFSLNVIF